MNSIKGGLCVVLAAFGLAVSSGAQVPPAEQLLPSDTLAVFSIPDWTKLNEAQGHSAWGQLWGDLAMKPFRDNFVSNFQADLLKPIEKELGVSLAQYQELLRGQITVGLLPPKEGSTDFASIVLLMDSKDKAELLTAKLGELRKKWSESGKEMKTEKIRDIDFHSVAFSKADVQKFLQKAFPASEPDDEGDAAASEKIQLLVGQFKSLLIVSEDSKAIEKILARQSGGLVAPLAEQAAYQKSHSTLFRDSIAHGWVNFKPIYEKILKFAAQEPEENAPPGMPQMRMDKLLPALGIGSLQTIAGKVSANPEGTAFEMFAGVPEAQREGISRLLTLEKKDSAPPAFVPADTLKFQRTRIDAQKAWTTIEGILTKIDPSLAGLVQLMLSSAGKDQDPNFDLKKDLIGNVGDDFIQYQKAPRGTTAAELNAAPSLFLIGSPKAPALVDAVRMITSMLPPPLSTAPIKEREFLGRKVYSLTMAGLPEGADESGEPKPGVEQTLSFTASGGYVAFSTDNAILEEYLRSGENPPKPLRGTAGFADAAQRIGGLEGGYFAYENQADSMRILFEAVKKDPDLFNNMLPMVLNPGEDGSNVVSRYFNVKLLPSYDRIAKYFGFVISSAGSNADGFTVKAFGPKPPELAR